MKLAREFGSITLLFFSGRAAWTRAKGENPGRREEHQADSRRQGAQRSRRADRMRSYGVRGEVW